MAQQLENHVHPGNLAPKIAGLFGRFFLDTSYMRDTLKQQHNFLSPCGTHHATLCKTENSKLRLR